MAHIGINCLSVVPGELGGAETYLLNLVHHLAQIDSPNQYSLFVAPANRELFVEACLGLFGVVELPIRNAVRPTRIAYEQTLLPAVATRSGVDVLHAPGNTAPLFPMSPVVLSVQSLHVFKYPDMFPWHKRRYLQLFVTLSLRRASRIIAVSSDTKGDILSSFSLSESKVAVVYEGVGPQFCDQASAHDAEVVAKYSVVEPFVFCPSTLYPYKNVGRLLDAWAILKSERSVPGTLVVAGGDWQDQSGSLAKRAHELDLTAHYTYLGMLPHSEMPAFYRMASLMVYPSLAETFGLPLLESMACATPVVAANRTSLPEVGGDAAYYFDPTDTQAIADAIHVVLSDQAIREALIRKGLERVQRFTWTRAAQATLEVYEAAVANA